MLKQKYFLTGIFILSAERQPIKLAWRKIVWLHKAELLEMKLALLHNMNLENNIEYKQTIDSLIAIKPNTEMYYIEAVNSFPEIKDKIEYIDKAIAIYPNDYSLYRKKRRLYG